MQTNVHTWQSVHHAYLSDTLQYSCSKKKKEEEEAMLFNTVAYVLDIFQSNDSDKRYPRIYYTQMWYKSY